MSSIRWTRPAVYGGLIVWFGVSCSLSAGESLGEPTLPSEATEYSPSHMRVVGQGAALEDLGVQSCVSCHPAETKQWRSSSHAWASFNNALYRVSVEAFREETSPQASLFCGGCHDPLMVAAGTMEQPVQPEDALAHQGVTCGVCHGITDVKPDGNASFTLGLEPIPVPSSPDPAPDDPTLIAHRERVGSSVLRTADLCISCHRGFLTPDTGHPHFMVGLSDADDWQGSAFAGDTSTRLDDPVVEQDCAGCHMPQHDGVFSHRFVGGHTALAASLGDDEQLALTQKLLSSSVTVDVAAAQRADGTWILPADGAVLEPGEALTLDVVVRNTGAGHRFPAGTLDLQDTWLEVTVTDVAERVVASAGEEHASTGSDPTAFRLRALVADEDGRPVELHQVAQFRTPVWNHTIPSRSVQVMRYVLPVPQTLSPEELPLRVSATVFHRSRRLDFAEAACAAASDAEGVRWQSEAERFTGIRPDACRDQPVTVVAQTEIFLGGGEQSASIPVWRRLYEHGLGHLGNVQERVPLARESLERALHEVSSAGTPHEQALVLAAIGELEGKLGRSNAMLEAFAAAEELAPDAAGVAAARGRALSQVWRWEEAEVSLQIASDLLPDSVAVHRKLAVARGSLGDYVGALEATERGLAHQPRDATLLRVQALAMEGIRPGAVETEAAREAFLAYRPYDAAPHLRGQCSLTVPGCADERLPVPTLRLRPPSSVVE